nr:receptor-like protein kinase HERK 1 [Ipomoea batatas]
MGDVLWNLEFALQLQRKDETTSQNHHDCANVSQPEISTSTTQFSIGSMGDLAGVSISRVFSQMFKVEISVIHALGFLVES